MFELSYVVFIHLLYYWNSIWSGILNGQFEWIDRNGFESFQPIYVYESLCEVKKCWPIRYGSMVSFYATHICFYPVEPPKTICIHIMLTFLSSGILFECSMRPHSSKRKTVWKWNLPGTYFGPLTYMLLARWLTFTSIQPYFICNFVSVYKFMNVFSYQL